MKDFGKTLIFYYFVLLTSLLPVIAESASPTYRQMHPDHNNFKYSEIPLNIVKDRAYISVEIQGKQFDLLLDTGAGSQTISLTPDTISKLKVQDVEDQVSTYTNYGSSVYRRFLLDEVKIGNIAYYNLLCDRDEIQNNGSDVGFIGLSLLKEFNFLIDYNGSKVVLYPKGNFPEGYEFGEWQKHSFTDHEAGIMVKGKFQGSENELDFIIDTGAIATDGTESYNLMKGDSFVKIGPIPSEDENGNKIVRSQDIIIDGESIRSLNFFFSKQFTQPQKLNGGFLGCDFFKKYSVFFDFGDEVMFVKKVE